MDLRAAILAVRRRLPGRLARTRPSSFAADDFDWRDYNRAYRREMSQLEEQFTTRLNDRDAVLSGESLGTRPGVAPLHPNHRLLYETVMLLEPTDVVEAGCGGGDHLHNLSVLLPDVELRGFDWSEDQLSFFRERNPALAERVRRLDLTLPVPADQPAGDVVFTQAVIMHIQTGNGHRVALTNLFTLAKRQVVLMESWTRHDFLADVQALHQEKIIRWDALHAYIRRSPELGDRPHIMVLSAEPLPFEPLTDYRLLTDPPGGSG